MINIKPNKYQNTSIKNYLTEIHNDNGKFTSAIYLDIPCYHNLGDMLIYLGAKKMLHDLNVTVRYTESALSHNLKKIKRILKQHPDTVILMQGGGNFGDLYSEAQTYRLNIIKKFKNEKIIILPQTIWYDNYNNYLNDKEIIKKAKNLTIYTRDERSFNYISNITSIKINMMPDTAHWLWDDGINILNKKINHKGTKKILIHRTDDELSTESLKDDNYHKIFDWPNLESSKDKLFEKIIRFQQRKLPFLNNLFIIKWDKHMYSFCSKGVSELNEANDITTSRLHGFILSYIMNKNVSVLDNRYGKNYSYIKKWINND